VFLLQFGRDWFRSKDWSHVVYFTEANCRGDPYIQVADGLGNVFVMRGTDYALGPSARIYRTIRGQATETVSVKSRFNTDGLFAGGCSSNSALQANVAAAIPVMDLGFLVPPFTVE